MAFKDTVKQWFKTGLKPTQAQFYSKFDFLRWKDEKIVITDIEDIESILDAKADAEALLNHIQATFDAIDLEAQTRANKDESLQFQIDDTNDFVSQARSDIEAIKTILNSDDINLDTVQEIVDAIKTVEISLETILVNDLTTGGVSKALTGEMGKTLKGLIDGLTTNKVEKVAGERLINAAEITKLSGLSNVTTTVKTITSASLATQDVAGFVAYINALAVVLVVGANETVKYKTTDTGRVFELLLRGRSFGIGQAAITAADVLEVTEFLNKDVTLSNYPSTRNDGALPTNKVLSVNAAGKVGLYTMAVSPAPWIRELIPDSYLPSTTGNIRILGDFFTPAMCDRVNNPNAIILGGVTTIHYATFVSSQEILINVTTGNIEGTFSCTLDNGLSATKGNALLIVLGTVYKPITSDWINTIQPIEIDNNNLFTKTFNSLGTSELNVLLDRTKKFSIYFDVVKSPLGTLSTVFELIRLIDTVNSDYWTLGLSTQSATAAYYTISKNGPPWGNTSPSSYHTFIEPFRETVRLYWDMTTLYFYYNGLLRYTFPTSGNFVNNQKLQVSVKAFDIIELKYVEHS